MGKHSFIISWTNFSACLESWGCTQQDFENMEWSNLSRAVILFSMGKSNSQLTFLFSRLGWTIDYE